MILDGRPRMKLKLKLLYDFSIISEDQNLLSENISHNTNTSVLWFLFNGMKKWFSKKSKIFTVEVSHERVNEVLKILKFHLN